MEKDVRPGQASFHCDPTHVAPAARSASSSVIRGHIEALLDLENAQGSEGKAPETVLIRMRLAAHTALNLVEQLEVTTPPVAVSELR